MDMFLCITPKPPNLAKAIAISFSVTVSIAAETIGMFNFKPAKSVETSVSFGSTHEAFGTNKTSSKVYAFFASISFLKTKSHLYNLFNYI